MPELISGIDNFAKGLTAPIHRPVPAGAAPRCGGLPEGRPQPRLNTAERQRRH